MLRVLGPRVRRPFEVGLGDIFKACSFEDSLQAADVKVGTTELVGCVLEKLRPAVEGVGFC
jgi:hypothetical protein